MFSKKETSQLCTSAETQMGLVFHTVVRVNEEATLPHSSLEFSLSPSHQQGQILNCLRQDSIGTAAFLAPNFSKDKGDPHLPFPKRDYVWVRLRGHERVGVRHSGGTSHQMGSSRLCLRSPLSITQKSRIFHLAIFFYSQRFKIAKLFKTLQH